MLVMHHVTSVKVSFAAAARAGLLSSRAPAAFCQVDLAACFIRCQQLAGLSGSVRLSERGPAVTRLWCSSVHYMIPTS